LETPVVAETPVLEPTVIPTENVQPTALATDTMEATETTGVLVEDSPRLVSNLLGYNLETENADDLGEIDALVVDRNSGIIEYAVVGAGGFLDIGDEELLVPLNAFQIDPSVQVDDNQAIALTVDPSAVQNAPTLTSIGLGDINDIVNAGPDWDADVRTYWSDQLDTLPVTGEQAQTAAPIPLTDGTDVNVVNQNGDNLGDIENMILSENGDRVQYAILATGGFLDIGERLIPIPFSAYGYDDSATTWMLTLDVDQTQLESAPNYNNLNELPDINVQGWDDAIQNFWNDLTS
jgi:sporulation protein YlmC with PRC-barrel domain